MSEPTNKTARSDNVIVVGRHPAQSERPDVPGTQQGVELARKSRPLFFVHALATPTYFSESQVWRRSPVFIPRHKMLSHRVPPERHAPQDPRAREHLALVSGSELLRRALRDAMSQRAAVAEAAKVGHTGQGVGVQPGQPHGLPRWGHSATTAALASFASVLHTLAKSAHQKVAH